ncbi:MAG: class I SAM-dependent RNA methyltransferase [Lachnospiraceae bacterium]|nr:class I SAM-dependent RNA methyltransferase [Lachnospiraceae bacterium]
MRRFDIIAPCHFGLEAVLKKEITDLGYDVTQVSDGRVTFAGDEEAVVRANIFLRTAERVMIKVCEFKAMSFDELFEKTKAVRWHDYIPADGSFWVKKASSVRSKLYSPSDIQRIMKKAMIESMKNGYGREKFEENGKNYPIRVFINKDVVTASLDTTGESLHKRGYRKLQGAAPVAENLAAAILMLTPWKEGRILVDPFCGSGTVLIEAAMMAANIAPGMNRAFNAQDWPDLIDRKLWYECIDEANDLIKRDVRTDIQGYDIDGEVLKAARKNAYDAGVEDMIHFQQRPVKDLSHHNKYGFVVTNPPYGERLEEKEALKRIYQEIGEAMKRLDTWSFYVLTAYEDAQKSIGRRADKNRKIYNGMIKTYLYSYEGPKPPKKGQMIQ